MRNKTWTILILIIFLSIIAFLIAWPSGPDIKIGNWYKELKIHRGLDLQGGTHLIYELEVSKIDKKDQESATQSVIDVIEKRVNALGLSEPQIQATNIENKPSVIVELPGIKNIDEAIELIGKTAQLTFWEYSNQDIDPESELSNWEETKLTGAQLRRADVVYDPNTNNPQVAIEFNDEGKNSFSELTEKNIGKPLAIVLDNEIISAPTVQTKIPDGQAVITGDFSINDAKNLAKLLNAGALPVPINVIEQRNIEASLGAEAIKQSIFAGLLGLILLGIYLIVYYRYWGLVAVSALIIYTLIMLAIFKLIPITLTLAGIAGFILSIGMAVDANVLIFERMKEELKSGKTTGLSVKDGFARAWPSIRDSNITTLIICVILYFTNTGMVKGFAITLFIGILVSMFSAITITKNVFDLISTTKLSEKINKGNI